MRFASGPLDWLAGGSLHTRTQIITSDFEHFVEESDRELRERDCGHGIDFPHDCYYNTHNGLKHYHDFEKGIPLSETYPAVREKYNRRLARFQRVYPIFTRYAVRNSRTLIRRQQIKRFIIRTFTALIPCKKWRKLYGQSEITW